MSEINFKEAIGSFLHALMIAVMTSLHLMQPQYQQFLNHSKRRLLVTHDAFVSCTLTGVVIF
jgi:hypothetical protein